MIYLLILYVDFLVTWIIVVDNILIDVSSIVDQFYNSIQSQLLINVAIVIWHKTLEIHNMIFLKN